MPSYFDKVAPRRRSLVISSLLYDNLSSIRIPLMTVNASTLPFPAMPSYFYQEAPRGPPALISNLIYDNLPLMTVTTSTLPFPGNGFMFIPSSSSRTSSFN